MIAAGVSRSEHIPDMCSLILAPARGCDGITTADDSMRPTAEMSRTDRSRADTAGRSR
jgi:hypothetical protein